MTILLIVSGVLLLLALAWILLLLPRRHAPGWEALAGARYAHRGLHDLSQGRPENSMAAFRAAAAAGCGAELDVHLLRDGSLAVVHDSSLERVCGRRAVVEELTEADLPDYPLQGTAETIPLLEDVLAVFAGGPPLVIELKAEGGNAAALTDAVMARLAGWEGTYCIESFHPAVLLRLKRRYPQVLRGQLSQNFLRDSEGLSWPVRAVLTLLLTTAFTRPDFIAYRYRDRACPSLRLMRRLYGVHEVGWTVRDRAVLERLEREGVTPIFEGFQP